MRQAKIVWEETLSDVAVREDRQAVELRFQRLMEALQPS
jgi:hypothetical protein